MRIIITTLFLMQSMVAHPINLDDGNTEWQIPDEFEFVVLKPFMEVVQLSEGSDFNSQKLEFKPLLASNFSTKIQEHLVRIKIRNSHDEAIKLKMSTFFLDSIVVYRISENLDTILYSTNNGYLVPFEERAFTYHQSSIVPLEIPPQSTYTWLFHIINPTKFGKAGTKNSVHMAFTAYSESGFKKWYVSGERYQFMLLGIAVLLILFNFSIYIWGQEKSYGYLAIYNFGFALWLFVFGGMLVYFDIIHDPVTERLIRKVTVLPTLIFGYSFFTYHFLDLNQNAPRLGKMILSLAITYVALTLTYVINFNQWVESIVQNLSIVLYILIFAASIVSYRQKQPFAGIFIVNATLVNVGVIVILFYLRNAELNYWVGHYISITMLLIEALVFTIITSGRFITFQRERKILEGEKTTLSDELIRKNRELTTYLVEQVERNKALESLKMESLKLIKKEDSKHKIKRHFEQILNASANWDTFREYFENVHPNFLSQLLMKHPTLTLNDQRISAFLKMGLKTKEIATINGVSPRAVEKARERLKKKMAVSDLMQEINQI